ncbi:hypothetical protein AB0H88_48110 [Nonomuraea sp. NPDC050680]
MPSEFDFENQTADAQSKQFGYNCDFVTVFPIGVEEPADSRWQYPRVT